MRYLAIDLGDKRTGLAVGDDVTGIVTPREVVVCAREADRLRALRGHIAAYGPDVIVIGLPINMDGSEGPRAKLVREFAAQLQAHTAARIEFQDERLSSYHADQMLARSGRTHEQKKRMRDALAAATILRDYFDREVDA